jgi:hypothetical protein
MQKLESIEKVLTISVTSRPSWGQPVVASRQAPSHPSSKQVYTNELSIQSTTFTPEIKQTYETF